MMIPKSVDLLFKTYAIGYESGMRNEKGEMLYGQIDYIEQTITLNKAAKDEQAEATLIHEIIHGLDELYNIGLKEKQVEKLGNAFYMLIRDNPEMFREEVPG